MNNRELKKLFQTAKQECQPNADWVNDTRNLLLSQVRSEIPEQSVPFLMKFADHLVPANLAFKPVAVFSLILGLLLISSFGSVNAAKDALPGDTLYGVKITAENVKYNLAFSQEQKAKMAMSMVENRVGELKVIVEKEDNGEKEHKVVMTTKKIKDSLDKVKDKVVVINNEEAVKEIDEKLAVVKDEIIQTSEVTEEENGVANELAQAVEDVEEASDVVMAVLTENTEALKHLSTEALKTETSKQDSVEGAATSTTSSEEAEEQEPLVTTTPEVILPVKDVKEVLGIEDEEEGQEFGVKIGY